VTPPILLLVFLFISLGGVRLSLLGTFATGGPTVPAPDDDECVAVAGMRSGRRNPEPLTLCPA
jgi:hypothetical protein